jgi:hypothetical protein
MSLQPQLLQRLSKFAWAQEFKSSLSNVGRLPCLNKEEEEGEEEEKKEERRKKLAQVKKRDLSRILLTLRASCFATEAWEMCGQYDWWQGDRRFQIWVGQSEVAALSFRCPGGELGYGSLVREKETNPALPVVFALVLKWWDLSDNLPPWDQSQPS